MGQVRETVNVGGHASTEACLTDWPSAQPQGWYWCSVAQHH